MAEQLKIKEITELCQNEDESAYVEYHTQQMAKRAERKAKSISKKKKSDDNSKEKGSKASRFIDVTTGEYKYDKQLGEDSEFASRSPVFNRKKYPYLSEKEFTTKRPRV